MSLLRSGLVVSRVGTMHLVHFPLSGLPVLCILAQQKALHWMQGGMVLDISASRAMRKVTFYCLEFTGPLQQPCWDITAAKN